ncbi:MAG: hypothetical protein L0191_15915, partial [Acidobacteria bacterium]|nr:hypothetical protein [Acidobacteriota bacterium]
WARGSAKIPLEEEIFRVAWILELPEVMDALEENPHLPASFLLADATRDYFSEPGIFFAADILLIWSALRPTRLLARLIASFDEDRILQESRSVQEPLQDRRGVGIDLPSVYQGWIDHLRVPLAIAWSRCRGYRVT